ncbi:MAG: ATP-binding protein [Syntrophomonadaceae bacterium]|nr:ATP-binding protein [Syntrophomonadaceae bacterium]
MYPVPWYAIILITIPQTILIIKLGCGLFNININMRQCLLMAIILGVAAYILRRLPLMFGLHTVIMVLVLTALIIVISRIDWGSSFVSVLLGVMIVGVVENTFLPFFLKLTESNVNDLAAQPWLSIAGFWIQFLPVLILYAWIHRHRFIIFDLNASRENRIPGRSNKVIIAVILLQNFLLTLIMSNMIGQQSVWRLNTIIPWANIGLLFIALLGVLAIKQLELSARNNVKINLLKTHLQQVETLLGTLQAQKHEYSRHIQAIQSLVYLNRHQEAKQYIEAIAEDYWHMEDMIYSGDPVINGLLNSKRSAAESQGIEFAVAVKCDLDRIPIPPWDMCSILGNLLDNAVEAASEDPKQPRVAVEFKYELGHYVVYIHNNGRGISAKEKEVIFVPGYTSKDSAGRGYGLYLVKKLLDRYGADIEIISKKQTSVIVRLDKRSYNAAHACELG